MFKYEKGAGNLCRAMGSVRERGGGEGGTDDAVWTAVGLDP